MLFKGICLNYLQTMKHFHHNFIKSNFINSPVFEILASKSKIFVAKNLTAVLMGAVGIVGITQLPLIKPATAQVIVDSTAANNFTNPQLSHTFKKT